MRTSRFYYSSSLEQKFAMLPVEMEQNFAFEKMDDVENGTFSGIFG